MLLVTLYNGTATLENSIAISQNVKLLYDPTVQLLDHITKKIENMYLHKDSYMNVHCGHYSE